MYIRNCVIHQSTTPFVFYPHILEIRKPTPSDVSCVCTQNGDISAYRQSAFIYKMIYKSRISDNSAPILLIIYKAGRIQKTHNYIVYSPVPVSTYSATHHSLVYLLFPFYTKLNIKKINAYGHLSHG